ncbi:hypothetical protein [Fluviicola sp.]|uniref:hypothetical protein n=1 Tax=Fluviicola sp. TaxID=1917219 RepID=UPI0026310DDF|nr:hypothetical protein [Fluviicola sp.]
MSTAQDKKNHIIETARTIYDNPDQEESNLVWYTKDQIEELIAQDMVGKSFHGLPLRTRSKVSKTLVCESLGYKAPGSFKKTKPRFPAQNLDTYVQKSNNLQVWNDELDPARRYLLIRLDDNDVVISAKVVTGVDLAVLDTTGTLTQKYQARLKLGDELSELISKTDTEPLKEQIVHMNGVNLKGTSPIEDPTTDNLFPIETVYSILKTLIGATFKNIGADQERNRGAELHKLVCEKLGYDNYADNGQFPDVKNQLLEIKLQTSPTIDLGLVCPDSDLTLDINPLNGFQVRHRDVRYALYYGKVEGDQITLTHFYLTTGADFFNRFQQFQGKILNKKLQIPLPKDFFNK